MTAPPAAPSPSADGPPPGKQRTTSGALLVGIGIFFSRVFGLVRQSAASAYLGGINSIEGDAFAGAMRIPNALQNMLGEGALSASFIPVYRRMLVSGDREGARRLAAAIGAILALVVAIIVAAGVFGAPALVDIINNGFTGDKRLLAIQLTRVFFPSAGLLVLSAWCLAIQNSHEKFLLSYLAPIAWNVAMIVAFTIHGQTPNRALIAETAVWGSLIGAALQFLIQVPGALRLLGGAPDRLDLGDPAAKRVVRNFAPVALSRGVVQVSSYIDTGIASNLADGLQAILSSVQTVSTLPVSLFGMAISASELPVMSGTTGTEDEQHGFRRARLVASSRQVAFFVIPSAVAFVLLGDVIIRVLFQRGAFDEESTLVGWSMLAPSALGLVASTQARLYANVFYSMHDTRTPVLFAVIRVVLAGALAYVLALHAPGWFGINPRYAGAAFGLASGVAGWTEFLLLRRSVERRIGTLDPTRGYLAKVWGAALLAGVVAVAVWRGAFADQTFVEGITVLLFFGVVYAGITLAGGIPEARVVARRLRLVR